MRPLYAFLLAGSHHPRVLGFCSPPSPFVPQQPLAPTSRLTSTGHAALSSRRTGQHTSSTATAALCGRDRLDFTRQRSSSLGIRGVTRSSRRTRWTRRSASTVQHSASASAVGSSPASSSSSRRESGSRVCAGVMPGDASKIASSSNIAITSRTSGAGVGGDAADPTAAAHAYLSEFLGMTEEELQQLSAKYRSLPAKRRGPEEITMASPELAAVATSAADAAAEAFTAAAAAATTASGIVAAEPVEESSTGRVGGIGGGVAGRGGGGRQAEAAAGWAEAREEAVKVAADEAAAAAAGRLLVSEIPALASMLPQQLGVPKERVKRLLLKWPRLLEVSGYHLRECVQWLAGTLGLRQEEVAKLFLAYPPLLIKSVNFQLQPNLAWLENDLGLTRAESRKAVCSCPQLLAKCVSSNFMPKIEFFHEVLRVDRQGVSGMLLRYPQLFNFSLENMAWKARWLEQELLLDPYQVRRVLTRCPSVFAYSAERNLVPTLEFFLDELGATKAQVREAVISKPRLLGMSLENRLVPRLQEIRGAGFTPSWESHHEVMLFASDIVFRRWLREEPTGAARRRREALGGLSQTGRRHH